MDTVFISLPHILFSALYSQALGLDLTTGFSNPVPT